MNLKRDFADQSVRQVIADYIQETIGDALQSTPQTPSPLVVREVAHGVAAYLDDSQSKGMVIPNGRISGLTSRALGAVGEVAAARHMLLFGEGLARVSAWTVTGGRTVVALDLARFLSSAALPLELVFYAALDESIKAIAEFWDEGSGAGALGLRNLNALTHAFTGRRASRRRSGAFIREVTSRCNYRLDLLRRTRGWRATPAVLRLDPAG